MKTINELRKSAIDKHPDVIAARKAHKAGNWDGNVDKDGEAIVYINDNNKRNQRIKYEGSCSRIKESTSFRVSKGYG